MPKSDASIILDESPKPLTGWDMAIRDAERRIRSLQAALSLFKQKRDKGEPWPGTVKSDGSEAGNAGGK